MENDAEAVSWLCSQGFDLNARNRFGIPVVFEIAQLEYQALLEWFVSKGVDLKCRDGEGRNLKEYLREFGREDMLKHIESLDRET